MRYRFVFALTALLAAGCNQSPARPQEAGGVELPTPSRSAAPVASTAPVPSTSASSPAPSGPTAWTGTYKSNTATLYVPTDAPNGGDWKGVKWRGDDSRLGLGEGAMAITVEPGGRFNGTLDGPLGPALVFGVLQDNELVGTVARKTTSDQGFTGTATGKVSANTVEGTLQVAVANASVLRTATFVLRRP
ncbi:MAG: hypothetical protein WCI05_06395 [Myxococcales bacterium]